MAPPRAQERILREAADAVRQYGSEKAAAAAMGVSRSTLQHRLRAAKERGFEVVNPWLAKYDDFEVPKPPVPCVEPIEDLLARRRKVFERKAAHKASKGLIDVYVKVDGPYGILHMGDPHVDDDGCNLPLLEQHINLVKNTRGLFGANVGDMSNNWIGRLARLYSAQSTTASEAVVMVEWLISSMRWLYLVGGNHDAWSGAADPVRWFAQNSASLYEWHGVRIALHAPAGQVVRVNARHDWSGTSQWNAAHGPMKAAMLGYERDHIYVCGHRHAAASSMVNWEDGSHIAHALRVGSYKQIDDFADAKGFPRQNMPAVLTIINPQARTPAGLVTPVWDADEGADFLTHLRSRK
jgi:hypothetical protein